MVISEISLTLCENYSILRLWLVLVFMEIPYFIRLKEKQTSHTSARGFIGLLNSYLVQQSILLQLISGQLAVSLLSFFWARFVVI